MSEHYKRIRVEYDQLVERLGKLDIFIEDSPIFPKLDKDDRRLLVDQRAAMTVYRNILRQRMAESARGPL